MTQPQPAHAQGWYRSSWSYRKSIAVNASKLSASLSQFPVLFSQTDTDLKADARSDAADIVFTASDGTTRLAHEIERYSASDGSIVAWIKLPALSSTTNTVFYVYYGNAAATASQNASDVWDSNFRAVWHSTGSGGSTVPDSTSYANTGTLASSPSTPVWNDSGKVGGALSFDGLNDYISFPNSSALDVTGTQLTVSGWFKITSTRSLATIFAKFQNASMSSPYYQYGLEHDPDRGKVGFSFASNSNRRGPVEIAPSLGSWQYMAFTYNGSQLKGYLNGNAPQSRSESDAITSRSLTSRMGSAITGANPFEGLIDELRISSVARSAAWLAAEYNNQNSPSTFVSVGTEQSQSQPKLVIHSVNGGSPVAAGVPFSIVVESRSISGDLERTTSDTALSVTLGTGTGTLGGTLTGTLSAGAASVTLSGLTYTKAESGVVLSISRTSGDLLTASDGNAFTVLAGPVSDARSTVSATPDTVEADGISTATVTVTLRDASDNPISNQTVRLTQETGRSVISPSGGQTDASGVIRFTVSNASVETTTYSALEASGPTTLSQTASVRFTQAPWYDEAWSRRKSIRIQASQMASTLTNFPVLIQCTDPDLPSAARSDGFDILFTASDGLTQLAHEIESYASADGTLVAWVKVPTLSHVTDTTLFVYYGNDSATDQQSTSQVWDTGFQAVWHAGESTGSNLADATSRSNDATLATSPARPSWTSQGRIGRALQFDGVDDKVSVLDSDSLDIPGTALTVSGWVQITDSGADAAIFGKFYNSSMTTPYYHYGVEFKTASDSVNFYFGSEGSQKGPWPVSVTPGEWQYVAFAYDGTKVTAIVNGNAPLNTDETAPITRRGRDLRFGTDQAGTKPFTGSIDEWRVSNVARSADWLATEFLNQSDPSALATFSEEQNLHPPQDQTLSFTATDALTYGDGPRTLVATASSGLSVTWTLISGPASLDGSSLTLTGAGTVVVEVSQPGNDRWNPATPLRQSLTVSPKTVTPSVTIADKTYDGTRSATIQSRSLSGIMDDDEVTLTGGTALFADASVGASKSVSTTGLQLDGSAADNYILSADSATSTAAILPGTASELVFTTEPDSAVPGSALGQQPVVRTRDAFGNNSAVGLPAHLNVTVALSSGTGILLGTTTLDIGSAAGDGIVAFTNLRVDASGSKTLRATASGLTGGVSAAFQVPNASPVLEVVQRTRPRHVPLKIPLSELLAHASDLNGDSLRLASVSASTNGATVLTNATYLLYNLPPGGNVNDRFTIEVTDGTSSTSGEVVITMLPTATCQSANIACYGLHAGAPKITFAGIPGYVYRVQRTLDLTGEPVWTNLTTTNSPPEGLFEYTERNPISGSVFYRAIHE